MSQQWVDVPLPRRLNTDGSTTGLDPEESPNLLNMITHEVGQIRQRRSWTRFAPINSGATVGDLPFTAITSANYASGVSNPTTVNTRALVGYFATQTGFTIPYRLTQPNGPYPAGYSEITNAHVKVLFVNADNSASPTTAVGQSPPGGNVGMPFGQTAQFDFSTFGTSVGRWTAVNKLGTTTNATHLVRWAGSNRTQNSFFANVANGSTAVTLSTTATPSLAGTFMNFSSDGNGKRFNYYVLSHVAGTANVVLSKPFGLGDNTIAGHTAFADSADFWSMIYVQNAPPDVQQCAGYLSRLFVGRPTVLAAIGQIQPGTYPQAVAWSDINEPEKWTDTNLVVLDNNAGDPIMGFGVLRSMLVIFRRYSVWAMTGSDESSFTFQQVGSDGCLDVRSITEYKDLLFYMSDAGLFSFDGNTFNNLTVQHLRSDYWGILPTRGIHTAYVNTSARFAFPETYPLSAQVTTVLPRTDFLLMSGQNLETASDARHDQYMYHIPSASWTRLNTKGADQLCLFTKPGKHLNNQCIGLVGSESMVLLDKIVEPEFMALGAGQGRYDETYTAGTSTPISTAVRSTVVWPDVRPANGNTVRLHRVMVEHNIWNSAGSALNGPDVQVDTDPFFGDVLVTGQTLSAGNVKPRYQPTETVSLYGYRFSTEVAGTTWPVEGSVFQIQLSTENVSLDATNAAHPPKYLGLRLLLEPTERAVVDNPVTS